MVFKKILGNYKEVIDALGLPEEWCKVGGDAHDTLSKDITRTAYFNSFNAVKQKRDELVDRRFCYTQGDLTGRIFSKHAFQFSSLATQHEDYLKDDCPLLARLNFSYLNDDNILCAFAMKCVKGVGEHEGKYFLNIAMIQDALADPDKRTVMFVTSPELLPSQEYFASRNKTCMSDIQHDAVTHEVLSMLKCKALEQHIQRACKRNEDAFLYTKKLNECFSSGQDVNHVKLEEASKSPLPVLEQMFLFAQEHPLLTAGLVGLFVASMVLVTAATCGAALTPVGLAITLGVFAATVTYGATQYASQDNNLKSNINSNSSHQ